MYVCIKIYVRTAAYSLDCHEGAMINCRLYRTFHSLSVSRTQTVISSCRELSVVVNYTVLGQSTRNFVVHSSWSCSNWWQGILSLLNVFSGRWMMRREYTVQTDRWGDWKYGQNCKGGKCRSGKCRSKPYGTPTRDYNIEKALSYFVTLVLILLTK